MFLRADQTRGGRWAEPPHDCAEPPLDRTAEAHDDVSKAFHSLNVVDNVGTGDNNASLGIDGEPAAHQLGVLPGGSVSGPMATTARCCQ